MMHQSAKIYIAGHNGMVGSALYRKLRSENYENLITRSSADLDLRDPQAAQRFFETEQPEYVFLAAAKVGGIYANDTYPADFIYDNLMIQANVIYHSFKHKVKKLLFLGSSCIYPKEAIQPIPESALLSGKLEPTNEAYAIAKIAGIKMCQSYRKQYGCSFFSVMPSNLYGPNDNYDLQNSHVLPALIRKLHEAKEAKADAVEIWGSGTPKREFLYVDDLANACIFLMNQDLNEELINVGYGTDQTIYELAKIVQEIVGFEGEIRTNTNMPDGMMQKLLDITKITQLGWKPDIDLKTGIRMAYEDYKQSL